MRWSTTGWTRIVGWHQAGGDLATLLASRYSCPALEATAVSTGLGADVRPSDPSVDQSDGRADHARPATTLDTPPVPRAQESGALVQAPSNITGICDRSIQSNIDAALDGTKDINDVITAVEPRLWNMSTVLPILQDTTIVGGRARACRTSASPVRCRSASSATPESG